MEGMIVLRVSGYDLEFDHISEQLQMQPTKVIRKGQFLALKKEADMDSWHHKISFHEDFCIQLDELATSLILHCDVLNTLVDNRFDVEIGVFIRSDMGQFGFELSPSLISKLADIGIPVQFHMLSYGLVE